MFDTKYITLLIFILTFWSCSLTDTDQPIPFYLDLKDPKVFLPANNGFDTHKITDVWVFADGQILGVFPLPARVPVKYSDSDTEITILAGIRKNGMNDTPDFYPFYKSIVKTIKPDQNTVTNIPLLFNYVPNAKIPVFESFETGNLFSLDLDNNPATNLAVTNLTSSLGNNSGVMTFTGSINTMEIGCIQTIRNGENARGHSYIEFDYKGEGEIAVGIAKTVGSLFRVEYVLFVPGKPDWNKIYVDVTDKLSQNDYNEYRLVFGFTKTGSGVEPKLYLDNIKHIHF